MAERRMISKKIIDSDAFFEMPITAQCLYFHLVMRADDDGFINQPKTIMRICGCKEEDFKILFEKKFVIPFENGIVVIKHWKIHNYIAKDRYKETTYKELKARLRLDENNAYTMSENESYTKCIQNVCDLHTQNNIDKISIDKISVDEKKIKQNNKIIVYANINITESELNELKVKMNDFCQGIPSWKFYLEYMNEQGKIRKKKYKFDDIIGWYEKDKSSGRRTFTTGGASYNIDKWKQKNIKPIKEYEGNKK